MAPDDWYWMIRSGQPFRLALICLTMSGLPWPRLALIALIVRPPLPKARQMSSAVTGSLRCGSGVTTGVGAGVGVPDAAEDDPQPARATASRPAAQIGSRRPRPA